MTAKNHATSTVATAPSPATSGTSLVVEAGEGARFPTPPFKAEIRPATGVPTPSNTEVVLVTGVSTDTLTITRAQESSTARTVVVGDRISATLTAGMWESPEISGPLSLGTNPAQSGLIRLKNNEWISSRNAANDADVPLWKVLSNNYLNFSTRIYYDAYEIYDDRKSLITLRRYFMDAPTAGARDSVIDVRIQSRQSGTVEEGRIGIVSEISDRSDVTNKTITGMSRVGTTVTVTATAHGYGNNDKINIYGVTHTFNAEVNGVWVISNVTTNTFDIVVTGLSAGTYTSGGTATNRGLMYAFSATAVLEVGRGGLVGTGLNGDDITLYTATNGSAADGRKATDAFYVSRNPIFTGSEFEACFSTQANTDRAFYADGKIGISALDVSRATFEVGAFALGLPNDIWAIGRNAANNGNVNLFKLAASPANELQISPIVRFIGNITLNDGVIVETGTTTGTKFGFTSASKLAFWGAAPIVQPLSTAELATVLTSTGLAATGWKQSFSRGATVLSPASGQTIMAWRAPFACTVTNIRSHFKSGTSVIINARRNQASNHLSANRTNSTADAWDDAGAVQNTAYAIGDDLELMIVTVNGAVTECSIQVDFTRP